MCVSSTAAGASTAPTIAPANLISWLALTAASSGCAAGLAAGGAAIAQTLPAPPACLLPLTDAPPPVAEAPPPPPAVVPMEEASAGISPLLLALGALALGGLLWLLLRDNDDEEGLSA